MRYTKAKPVKKGPLHVPVKDSSKGKKMPKAKPRSLGHGTYQKPEHGPRVV